MKKSVLILCAALFGLLSCIENYDPRLELATLPPQLNSSFYNLETVRADYLDPDEAAALGAMVLLKHGLTDLDDYPYARPAPGADLFPGAAEAEEGFVVTSCLMQDHSVLADGRHILSMTLEMADLFERRSLSANSLVYRVVDPDPADMGNIKARLRHLGYGDGLGNDETWDREAASALKAFQKDNGLSPSGTPDPDTLALLFPMGTCIEVLEYMTFPLYPPRPEVKIFIVPLETVQGNINLFNRGFDSYAAVVEHAIASSELGQALEESDRFCAFVFFMDRTSPESPAQVTFTRNPPEDFMISRNAGEKTYADPGKWLVIAEPFILGSSTSLYLNVFYDMVVTGSARLN